MGGELPPAVVDAIWSELIGRIAALAAPNAGPSVPIVHSGNHRHLFDTLLAEHLGRSGVRLVTPDVAQRERPDAVPVDVRDAVVSGRTCIGASVHRRRWHVLVAGTGRSVRARAVDRAPERATAPAGE
ncbi:MAG: hypothetical protein S0880_27880 [Actinomycetota bacterium]|nr:hypothetical protein [Actinomycetota bacterium]